MRRTAIALIASAGLLAAIASPAQGDTVIPTLTFGPQLVGTASAPQTVNISVYGGSGIVGATFSGVKVTEPQATCASCVGALISPDFTATASACPANSPSGTITCQASVTFHPILPPSGQRLATVWASVSGTDRVVASLVGTAVDPSASATKKKCKKRKSSAARIAKKKCKRKH
jgi:hypothetical protein